MPTNKSPLWHRAHYNALAKELRELFPLGDLFLPDPEYTTLKVQSMTKRQCLSALALSLAVRFKNDNPSFDPITFLDACSPDTDLFPLSELWENYE